MSGSDVNDTMMGTVPLVSGTVSGGSDSTDLVVTFNSSADTTSVSEVVQSLAYENNSTYAKSGDYTLTVVITDGDDGTSDTIHLQ